MTTSRYWPFDVRWAFIVSLVLVPVLVALAVWLYRPEGPLATKLTFAHLLVAVLLGLLPVLLVILDGVGSVEAAGVKVAFAVIQDVVHTRGVVTARSLVAENLGTPPGRVRDADSDTIIDSLRDALGNDSVVVDLKEGEEWWDTRLLVLASGAMRLSFPKAVVFTAATPDQARCFFGWATPGNLLRRLVAREPALKEAHLAAQRDWMKPEYPKQIREDGFEEERLLLHRLEPLEHPDVRKSLTEVRARELFGSVLHTKGVDLDEDEETWIKTILGSTADFFAVTRGRQFVNLVPQRTAVNSVLLALVSHRNGRTVRLGEPVARG